MKRLLWIALSCLTVTAFAAPSPAELGARAMTFLRNGRDVHVVRTGFFLDGGSAGAMLADASGQSVDLILYNERRAQALGTWFGVYDPGHGREYVPTGEARAVLQAALVAALKRSDVSNPNTRQLLDALTSRSHPYGVDIFSPPRGLGLERFLRPISDPRDMVMAAVVLILMVGLAFTIARRRTQARTSEQTPNAT